MKPSVEKLVLDSEQSFRCFDRSVQKLQPRWHRHPEIELTFVPTGTGSRLVGDHIATYEDCDLVLIGSNLPHVWMSDLYRGKKYDMHEAVVTQFHPNFLGAQFFEVTELRSIKELLKQASRGLWFPPEIANKVGQQLVKMTHEVGAKRLFNLLDCLERLAQFKNPTPLATTGYSLPSTKAAETRIKTVCDYTQQNFTDDSLTTSTLSDLLEMNPSAFCRFFKQSTGRTPSAYINELRIGYACRLLMESDRSVLDICLDSGFSSTSYFNRLFRKLRGLTPREYRVQHASLHHEKN